MPSVPRAELSNERYLQRMNCEYPEHVAAVTGPYDMQLKVLYQSEHEDWIQAMVIAGLGCACMPEFTPMFPELRTRPLVEPEVARTISVITKRGRKHAPVVDRFVRLCRSMKWGAPPDRAA